MIKRFLYALKDALLQMLRNKGMAVASLFAIIAMMILLNLSLFLSVNVTYLTDNVKEQFNTIEVFLLDETSDDQAQSMIKSLKTMEGVQDAKFIGKDQAMKEFLVRWGDNAYLLEGLSENPLPNSIRITLTDLESGDLIATACNTFPGVEDVRFYRDEVNKVISVTGAVQSGALILVIVLAVTSIIIVSNTIKLTVMARQEEIAIMKYIGATNWYIRGPLFLEGVIIGIIASLVSVGISSLLYIRLCNALGDQAFQLFSARLVAPGFIMSNIIWISLALGVSIGACGSMISMRRYLKA